MRKIRDTSPNGQLHKLDSGLSLFIREIATNPSAMGAAWPSFNRLARKIAAQVPLAPGFVVELGAGTGVVTSALLEHGITNEQLIVIERAATLTNHLQLRFPQLNIIQGDASQLTQLLNARHSPVHTIVSGLPLRSLPMATVQAIGNQIDNVLAPRGLYIQFTYSLLRTPLPPSPRLCWVHSEYSWWNLPPARVDVFRYAE